MSLKDKNIVIGISGSIAAYKIASLVRLLVKAEANVQVIMTEDAKEFITPLTLSTLSKNPVFSTYFDKDSGVWTNHVEIGVNADLLLIAPATANTLAGMANGLCNNLLLATYLSAKCPVYFAPAMDLDMWNHPATQKNVHTLRSFGNRIIHPDHGELASGLVGKGRLAEPETIFEVIREHFVVGRPLLGKKALVTAGPTYEAIDPVRFIGNHSSGKMGYAIANALKNLGADVTLISGPTHLEDPENIALVKVQSAEQMHQQTAIYFDQAHIIVMSAAVADYTPKIVATDKIKKQESEFTIDLKKTTDILATFGARKTAQQTLIGFALETNNEIEHAKGKLEKKNLDFIVLNSLNDAGAGFATDTNKITILTKKGDTHSFDLKTKTEVALDITALIVEHQNSISI